MLKQFTFDLRVYHEDVDCFDVVYHPNFLKFMERARLELALAGGHDFHRWSREGISFAVKSANIEYLRPARIYEYLQVVTRIVEKRRVSLIYEQVIQSPINPDHIYCKAQIHVVCLDKNMRPRQLPEDF